MTEKKSTLWGGIFTDLTDDNGCYELGKVNFYQLASHLENLYVLIADLQSEVNQLKKDNEFLKLYIWEHCSEIEALKEWSEDAQKYYD